MNERPPWTIWRYDTVDSTQRVASDLITSGAGHHRTAVVAANQSAGYGRKGDPWHDGAGDSLLTTVILSPDEPSASYPYAMIAALAVVRAIEAATHLAVSLKWPNDVLINGRKVAGILGDATWAGSRLIAMRVGIGVNVGGARILYIARGLPDATSLAAESGQIICGDTVLAALLEQFDRIDGVYCHSGHASIVAEWRNALATIGQEVAITHRDGRVLRGKATDATLDGDLIVDAADGTSVRVRAPDVRSLRHVTP